MNNISFGTDGWRGIMADDFTFPNVKIVAQAIANYVNENHLGDRGIVIGYDNRFLSPEFAKVCSNILTANRIKVMLTDQATPTPVVAFAVVNYKAGGAIMITASHNPPIHNGIKFIPEYGGPAHKGITDKILEHVKIVIDSGKINERGSEEWVRLCEPKEDYIKAVTQLVNGEVIKKANLTVICNPMFGAGIGYASEILQSFGCKVKAINNYRDPLFGGSMPEPTMANMKDLITAMNQEKADLGLATDGDADRFGVIDSKGNYISPNQVIYLLQYYLMKTRGWTGTVARTVATTYMVDRLAEKFGMQVIETPVGFKYIADALINKDAFLGGEESGGLSIKGHVPEKDGILACLLIAEMVARLGKTPTEIMEDLKNEIGYLYSKRLDVKCSSHAKEKVLSYLSRYKPETIGGKKIVNTISIDGQKFVMEDGSWVLIRASGTESLFRIYAEGNSMEQIDQIHAQIRQDLEI
ncbi:MAG: phosphoglucomutase/phosphomannomutase family protein [Deltaproteobacteria bacterium]